MTPPSCQLYSLLLFYVRPLFQSYLYTWQCIYSFCLEHCTVCKLPLSLRYTDGKLTPRWQFTKWKLVTISDLHEFFAIVMNMNTVKASLEFSGLPQPAQGCYARHRPISGLWLLPFHGPMLHQDPTISLTGTTKKQARSSLACHSLLRLSCMLSAHIWIVVINFLRPKLHQLPTCLSPP